MQASVVTTERVVFTAAPLGTKVKPPACTTKFDTLRWKKVEA